MRRRWIGLQCVVLVVALAACSCAPSPRHRSTPVSSTRPAETSGARTTEPASATPLPTRTSKRGRLAFHVAVNASNTPAATRETLRRRFEAAPVAPGADPSNDPPGQGFRWVEVAAGASLAPDLELQERDGKQYLLVWDAPGRAMTQGPGGASWKVKRAFPTVADGGRTCVGIFFDDAGARLLGELSEKNLGNPLAVVVRDVVVTVPVIQSRFSDAVIIEGGAEGMTRRAAYELARYLDPS